MAYTKAPEQQTYGTERIPLVTGIDVPAGLTSSTEWASGASAGMINILPFKDFDDKTVIGETRNGVNSTLVASGGTKYCRGMYVWEKAVGTVYYYVVVYDSAAQTTKVYTSTNSTSWTAVDTIATASTADGPVRFCEFIDSTNTKKLILVDGVSGYVYTSNAAGTKITDVDFPSPHMPFPVFLNGRIYLAKAATADIYNSALDDPTSWTAGDFISSEIHPDDLQALVKINNYILAVGISGCEYFYDAANPTASPLARDEGSALSFGCQIPNTIAYNRDTVVFLANTNDGESVLKVIEGAAHKEIPAKFLFSLIYVYVEEALATSRTIRASLFRQRGMLFYMLSLNGSSTGTTSRSSNPTFVYSFETGLWTEFATGSTAERAFPGYFISPSRQGKYYTYIAGHDGSAVFFGTLRSDTTSGDIDYIPVSGVLTSSDIFQEIRTTPTTLGTMNRKALNRLAVVYRMQSDPQTSASLPEVYTNDNFFVGGWGTGRKLVASSYDSGYEGSGFPFLTQLGTFRQRSFKIAVLGGIREWYFLELDYNKGQQ